MSKKKSIISDEDLEIFHQAMKGTMPLKKADKVSLKPTVEHRKPVYKPIHDEYVPSTLSDFENLDPVQGEEYLSYHHAGVSNKTLRKLRKGQYNVEAVLDLHGLTVDAARDTVDGFLRQCSHEKIRVVLIIHGKGHHGQMPILKNKLNHWLRELHSVLAFCSAAPGHGNRGAVYVLLRREENRFE